MNNPEEQWKNAFKASLSDYEKPGMDLPWAEVEEGVLKVKRRKQAFYWLGAASIAAALAIFFVSVFNVQLPDQQEKDELLASNQEIYTLQEEPVQKEVPTVLEELGNHVQTNLTAQLLPPMSEPAIPSTTERPSSPIEEVPVEKGENISQQEISAAAEEKVETATQNWSDAILLETSERTGRKNRISTGIYTGNPWTYSSSVLYDRPMLMGAPAYNTQEYGQKPQDTEPILGNANSMKTYEKYYQPIRYGLAINFGLTDHLSIGTGLYCSLLKSKTGYTYNETQGNEVIQHLWFIGMPLNLSYRFIDAGPFYAYSTLGGMAEVMIDGSQKTTQLERLESEKIHIGEHPWQFSATANLGLGIRLYEGLSLYAEPGITYYFKNRSNLHSFYSENPVAFSFNVGLRFLFE